MIKLNLLNTAVLFTSLSLLLFLPIQAKGGGGHSGHQEAQKHQQIHQTQHVNHVNPYKHPAYHNQNAYNQGLMQGEALEANTGNGNVYVVPQTVPSTYQNTGGTWIYEPQN